LSTPNLGNHSGVSSVRSQTWSLVLAHAQSKPEHWPNAIKRDPAHKGGKHS